MRVQELYGHITASIIRDLEAGVCTWVKPWKGGSGGGILPVNLASGREYSGINIPILWGTQQARGFPTNEWATYKQVLPLDAHVRKGEQGTTVVFTKQLHIKDKETEEEKKIGMLKTFVVFNRAQIDGLPVVEEKPLKVIDGAVKDFITSIKADIRHGGARACYVPSQDFVLMPNPAVFDTYEHYQATVLHELAHWSGHKSRLDRDLANRFGTKAYAAEELVAELSAAFLCAHLGIKGELKHAEYIANWIELLKEDNRAIFTASSQASRAADYIRTFSEKVEEQAA